MSRSQVHHRGVVVLDGDDTLWRTQELYDRAKRRFVHLLRREGLKSSDIMRTLDEIDSRRVPENGFGVSRFTESMVLTYHLICKEEQLVPKQRVEEEIKELGMSVTDLPKLYEDTLPSLSKLARRFDLVLVTKGQRKVQEYKVRELGLKKYFKAIHVSAKKSPGEYKQILLHLGKLHDYQWVVGNSLKSDVSPAVELGIPSIWIPRGIWRYEETESTPGNVLIAHSLSQAARTILARPPS